MFRVMSPRKRPLRHYLRSLYSWHRWLGVLSALFVLLLAATGFVLNRSDAWQLGGHAAPRWLQAHYGIAAPPPEAALELDGHWFTAYEGWLYYDDRPVTRAATMAGVVRSGDTYRVATDRGVATLGAAANPFADQAQLIDISNDALPDQPRARPDWKQPPAALAEALQRDAEGRALSWERVLLDLHSGRLFGRYGTLLMDCAAVLFVVLALSGITLWLRYQWRQQQRKRRQKTT